VLSGGLATSVLSCGLLGTSHFVFRFRTLVYKELTAI
jgi:hypothetical protein